MALTNSSIRSVALDLIDKRSALLGASGQKACLEFFDGGRSAGLWLISVEAQGELAVLRKRIAGGIPLDYEQNKILLNLTEAPPQTREIMHLRGALLSMKPGE